MTPLLLLDIALKGSVLVLIAAACAALSFRSTAAHRHYLWALALGGLLALPVLSRSLPWRLPVVPVPASQSPARTWESPIAPPSDAAPAPTPVVATGPDHLDHLDHLDRPTSHATFAAPSLATVLRTLWLAGALLVLLRLLAGVITLRWILRSARAVTDPSWQALLARTSAQLDLCTPVRLLESPHANMPMALGVWHPIVVLPMEADTWSEELREVVLLHELAHVRRRDVRANLVGQLACALYWFHPLVWTAARRLRIEAERACDDLVLGAGAPASNYAGHLLTMVQASASLRAPAFALPMAQRSAFEGRVLAILDPRQARHGVTRRAAAFGALVLLAVTVPLAALGPQQQEPTPARRNVARSADRMTARQLERIAPTQVYVATSVATTTSVALEARAEALAERASADMRVQEPRQGNPVITAGLIASLDDQDVSVRLAAVQALGNREDTAAVNALVTALRRDASKDVRKTAAWALGQIEDARAVPGLLGALRDERDHEVRNQIAWALGQIESKDAVAGLGAALRSEDDIETRRTMIWALGQIEDAAAVPFLVPMLRDGDAEVRKKTVWALGQIESKDAVEPLVAMFAGERTSSVRAQVLWALGQIEDARAVPALEAGLRDSSLDVRRKAIWAMGQMDNLHMAPAGLIAALHDPDEEIRRDAVRAIGQLEDPAAVPALAELLRDSDVEVRRNAVRALGEISNSASAQALVAALRDADPEVRRMAARALGDR
jgi:HEAT repeat protein/beta-lactamase regulating signal transducer with metallopeptidase domain